MRIADFMCIYDLLSLPILFVILLMMGMGTTLTGLIINMRLVTVSGVLGIFASLGCLYIDKFDQILLLL